MKRFYRQIEDAYIFANKTLLKLMLEERQLIPHLRSVVPCDVDHQSDKATGR